VILPIAEYEELLEDLEDLAAMAERRDEPAVSHDDLVAGLRRDGLFSLIWKRSAERELRKLPREAIMRLVVTESHSCG
jgi:hypothetical protein